MKKKILFSIVLLWVGSLTFNLQSAEKKAVNKKINSSKILSMTLPKCFSVQPIHGNLNVEFVDFIFKGNAPSLRLKRIYNPLFQGALGIGWKLNLEISLIFSGEAVSFIDEKNQKILFLKDSQGVFHSQKGRPSILSKSSPKNWQILWNNGEKWIFNGLGKLISKVNSHNLGIKLYYQKNRLWKVEDYFGRSIHFVYNAQGQIILAKDGLGRKIHYKYDLQDHLVSSKNYSGHKYSFSYEKERLVQIITPFRGIFSFEYNKIGKIRIINKNSQMLFSYTYKTISSKKQVTTIQDGAGRTQRISCYQKKDGKIMKYSSYSIGVNRQNDLMFFTTIFGKYSFAYNKNRNLISITNPLHKIMRYSYDKHHRIKSLWDFNGFQTSFQYDNFGKIVKIIDEKGRITKFYWNELGALVGLTNPMGQKTILDRDSMGNIVKTSDSLGRTIKRSYDVLGRLRRITGTSGAWVNISYNSYDAHPVQISNSAGQKLMYSYDKAGNLVQITAPNEKITRYSYDMEGRVREIQNSFGQKIALDYDVYENLKSLTLPGKKALYFFYNHQNHLVRATTLEGKTLQYKYDALGRLKGMTYLDGKESLFFWNPLGKLERIQYPNGDVAKITYNPMGQILSMANRDSHLVYKRDFMGRIVEAKDLILGKSVKYHYDKEGYLSSSATPFGKIQYNFNPIGWLKTLSLGKEKFQFFYHPSGDRAGISFPNKVTSTWIYGGAGRLSELITRKGNNIFQREKYSYDSLSNRTSISTLLGKTSFQYSEINQLIRVKKGSEVTRFHYDSFQNLIKKTVGNRLIRYLTKDDKIIEMGQNKYTYDVFGRRSSWKNLKGKSKYKYDYEGRLVSILKKGTHIRYGYTVDGRLIFRECNGKKTSYLYDGNNIIGEYEDGKLKIAYIHGLKVDMPLAMIYKNQTYYYHRDGALNITTLTNEKGKVVMKYKYDSFGRVIQALGSLKINPYLFSGRRFEQEANLYYYRARFYDASLGRFLSPDPLGYYSGINRYIYCGNNPINFRDPSGKFLHILTGAAIEATIQGGLSLGFQLWDNGGNIKEVDWGRVAGATVAGAMMGATFTATIGLAGTGTLVGAFGLGAGIVGSSAGVGQVVTNLWYRHVDKRKVDLMQNVGEAALVAAVMGGTLNGVFSKLPIRYIRAISYLGGSGRELVIRRAIAQAQEKAKGESEKKEAQKKKKGAQKEKKGAVQQLKELQKAIQ